MGALEQFWAEADRRYAADQRRIADGVITDAASTTSYTVQLPGLPAPGVSGVGCLVDRVPQVGDLVRVEFVSDRPNIVAVITPGQGVLSADVTTSQSTGSTAYVDLTTPGPSVPCLMVAGQTALVTVSCRSAVTSATTTQADMSFAVSGVESVAAADTSAAENTSSSSLTVARTTLYTAGSTGAHTFTAKYKVINTTTGTFLNRRLIVDLRG
jgi:hypothetical protein